MKIACYIRSDSIFNQVGGVLARAGFAYERFASETPMLHALRRREFGLLVAEMDSQKELEDQKLSWLDYRTVESTPVIMVSGAYSEDHVVFALNAGADDFMSERLHSSELVARLRAVWRRAHGDVVRRTIELQGFSLDHASSVLLDRGVPVELTSREFAMAWLLFSSPGVYIPRETISVAIWGVGSDIANRTIEQHVYKVRKKLKLGPERGVVIRTAYTRGYRLDLCDVSSHAGVREFLMV